MPVPNPKEVISAEPTDAGSVVELPVVLVLPLAVLLDVLVVLAVEPVVLLLPVEETEVLMLPRTAPRGPG